MELAATHSKEILAGELTGLVKAPFHSHRSLSIGGSVPQRERAASQIIETSPSFVGTTFRLMEENTSFPVQDSIIPFPHKTPRVGEGIADATQSARIAGKEIFAAEARSGRAFMTSPWSTFRVNYGIVPYP